MTLAGDVVIEDALDRQQRRLRMFLEDGGGFRLALATYASPRTRDRVIGALTDELARAGIRVVTLDMERVAPNMPLLIAAARALSEAGAPEPPRALMVIGTESHVDFAADDRDPGAHAVFATANLHRELFVQRVPVPTVLWLSPLATARFAWLAPDLWHWRAASFDFVDRAEARERTLREREIEYDRLSETATVRTPQHLALLSELLAELERQGDPGSAAYLSERQRLLSRIGEQRRIKGDLEGALQACREALEIASRLAEADPASMDRQRELSARQIDLGDVLREAGDLDAARDRFQAAREVTPAHSA